MSANLEPNVSEVAPGTTIEAAIQRKIILAKLTGHPVLFEFNGVTLCVKGTSDANRMESVYWGMKIRKTDL